MIGTKWINHKTKKVHKLLKRTPTTGGTFMVFEGFINERKYQTFHYTWYDEEINDWTKYQEYKVRTYGDDYIDYFFERIDNPNPSKNLIQYLRNNKLNRLL